MPLRSRNRGLLFLICRLRIGPDDEKFEPDERHLIFLSTCIVPCKNGEYTSAWIQDILLGPLGVAGRGHFLKVVFLGQDAVFCFTTFRNPPAMGMFSLMATSRAAWSAPVWPPDMIFLSVLEEILYAERKLKGLIWYLRIFSPERTLAEFSGEDWQINPSFFLKTLRFKNYR